MKSLGSDQVVTCTCTTWRLYTLQKYATLYSTEMREGEHSKLYFFLRVKKDLRLGSSFLSPPEGRVWDFPGPLSPAD